MESRKYFELNENKAYQYLWDTSKAALEINCIEHLCKKKKSQINDIYFNL